MNPWGPAELMQRRLLFCATCAVVAQLWLPPVDLGSAGNGCPTAALPLGRRHVLGGAGLGMVGGGVAATREVSAGKAEPEEDQVD